MKNLAHVALCATFFCVFNLSGCGGGGGGSAGGSTEDAAQNPPVAPAPALEVEEISPLRNAVNVTRDVQPRVTFNQALKASSISEDNVRLLGPLGAIAAAVNVSGSELTIAPQHRLAGGITYALDLGAAIESATGQALVPSRSFFTTISQIWQPPISYPSVNPAFDLKICRSTNGELIAVFERFNGARTALYSSRFVNGDWTTAVEIDDPAVSGIPTDTALVADSQGNAFAVWSQADGVVFHIYASRYSGGIWSAPARIETTIPGAGNAGRTALAADQTGKVMAVWSQSYNGEAIFARIYDGGWKTSYRIDDPSLSYSSYPAVVATANNEFMTIWRQDNFSRVGIFANYYRNSGWQTPIQIDNPSEGNAEIPTLTSNGNYHVAAAWRQITGDQLRSRIYVAQYNGDAWSPAQPVDDLAEAGMIVSSSPTLGTDLGGYVTVIWRQYRGSQQAIFANRFDQGGTRGWGVAQRIDDPANTILMDPAAIAVNSVGNVTVAWTAVVPLSHRGVFATRFSEGSWSSPIEIDRVDGGDNLYGPLLNVDINENVDAVWTKNGTINMSQYR